MVPVSDSFEFDYCGSNLVYGRNCVNQLSEYFAECGLERALVVCGSHVGANNDVMNSLERGLGDILIGIFDETTPSKSAKTTYNGIEVMKNIAADVIVGVGGGSSLDIARQISVFAADGRSLSSLRTSARGGTIEPIDPTDSLTPVITIPTTFAGADLSSGGSIELLSPSASPSGQPIRASGSIMPKMVFYDPNLFETTPKDALVGSMMNGFNKAIETIYTSKPTPITDSTAVHGLRLLQDGLLQITEENPTAMERAVQGVILAQFERQTSIIHAFGHSFSQRYPVQQGVIHAIVVPHVLQYIFDKIDARRVLIAKGLNICSDQLTDAELAEAIIENVTTVRDNLGLPSQLRELDPVQNDDFPAIARFILDDTSMHRTPEGLNPTTDEIKTLLQKMW